MKKLILFLALISILVSAPCWAVTAGTVTGAMTGYVRSGDTEYMWVSYTVTFGDGNAAPANVALNLILNTSGTRMAPLGGWSLFRIDTTDATTGPTDNTDLYLWKDEDETDVLGGNGVDQIDNANSNSFYPAVASQPLTGEELLDIDNNSVNDAETVIVFWLYK